MPNRKGASELLETLATKGLHLALAESLTGGLLTSKLVDIPGSSRVILGSIVAYQNDLKIGLLDVSRDLIDTVGPVDAQVALQMAVGVRGLLAEKSSIDSASVIGVSTTGVAGPSEQGGQAPGTAYVGVSSVDGDFVYPLNLSGSRQEIRNGVADAALLAIWEHLG